MGRPDLPDLPLRPLLPRLVEAVAAAPVVVLVAPPGAGKTTLAPLALLRAPSLQGRRILLLEPRRLAARAAAWRMAELLGEAVGETVGYRMRLDRKESARTRILVLTEGLLTRWLQQDPELTGVGMVLFDEVHERGLNTDLGLALCRDVQQGLRPDLRLVLMSATLDVDAIAGALGTRAVLRSEGRLHPVATEHLPPFDGEPLPRQVARGCLRALAEQPGGVLAFLPGEGEIRAVQRCLDAAHLPADVDLHALFGLLPRAAQDAALRPPAAGRRKLVLATAIAESSLTIEGVSAVVDAGWMRVSRFSPATGMARLETVRVSLDRADQRRGRAGRLAPGRCYRLWSAAQQHQLAPTAPPEIEVADLAPAALVAADWSGSGRAALPWLTPPPAAAWEQALELLEALGALDADSRITPHGRRMAGMPVHPRLAHMLLAATGPSRGDACRLAAMLSEQLRGGGEQAHNLEETLDRLQRGGPRREADTRVLALARQWERRLGPATSAPEGPAGRAAAAVAEDAGSLLARAYPDRIARRRPGDAEARYLLACGRGGVLRREDPLATCEWLVVAELDDAQADARIRAAAPLSAGTVEALAAARARQVSEVRWDRARKAVSAVERTLLGAIVLRERPCSSPDADAALRCLCEGLRTEGLACLPWNDPARQVRGRIAFLRRVFPDGPWPDLGDDRLAATLETWLGPFLSGCKSLQDAARVPLEAALKAGLDATERRALDRLAPTHWTAPSGTRVRIDYTQGAAPVAAVRLQEVLGLARTPALAEGRAAVLLHLLSPAGRPVQVTADLAGFWRSSYALVRKDLRGRYPKHDWPENPLEATPHRGVRRPPRHPGARDSANR